MEDIVQFDAFCEGFWGQDWFYILLCCGYFWQLINIFKCILLTFLNYILYCKYSFQQICNYLVFTQSEHLQKHIIKSIYSTKSHVVILFPQCQSKVHLFCL